MMRIIAPNKQYEGVSATVKFNKGIGQTDNPYLIDWFKKNGYAVEKIEDADKKVAPKKKSEEKKPTEGE